MKKGALFNQVPVKKINRNFFDLSHEVKLSGRMGRLIPFFIEDTIPGDVWSNRAEIMARMAPMLAPIMHRVDVRTEYFFVPNRLIWDEWEDFITGGPDGTSEPIPPYVTAGQVQNANQEFVNVSSLWDYMGLPPISEEDEGEATTRISSLPFRAYKLIREEYYRDQNLTTPYELIKTSGQESLSSVNVLFQIGYRAWDKDYFTSALPWTQRGAQVLIPIDSNIDVVYRSQSDVFTTAGGVNEGAVTAAVDGGLLTGGVPGRIENIESIEFDGLESTINELRRAVRLQEWLEANARGGARYTEQIHVHFDERVPDYRLQRPEYLGGSKQPMVISEVLATAAASIGDQVNGQVGDLAGHGLSVGRVSSFKYKCVEHGWIIGLLSIMPKPAYQQGVSRKWLRNDKFDYFWKEFAQIGEQAIFNSELFFGTSASENAETFGYTPRYAEYKYSSDRVAGQFRDSLAYWHMGRIFPTQPALNENFVQCDPFQEGLNRIFYVTTDIDNIWMQIYNHAKAYRKMPYFGIPTI